MGNSDHVLAVMNEYPEVLDFAALHYGEWVANGRGGFVASPHVIDYLKKAREACAAVAKLIEAAEDAMATIGYYAELLDSERGSGMKIEQMIEKGEEPEYVNLRDALARVKGESV